MSSRRSRNAGSRTASDIHRAWLELVDAEGPFLAVPPLKKVWPDGIPDFKSVHPGRYDLLRDAAKDFEVAWTTFDQNPGHQPSAATYRATKDKWVETVLRDVIGWVDSLEWGPGTSLEAHSPNRSVTVEAHAALVGTSGMAALVYLVDPTDSLRKTPTDAWAASPIDRLEALLIANDVEIGVVTDGRWWGLVCAGKERMAASGIVDALTWVEEPRTRDAFLTLLGRQYLIGGEELERLPALFTESIAEAEEVTEALGGQVRQAVELLIQSFSESASRARQQGLSNPLPDTPGVIYDAAVTIMMRVVFLLFAEDRDLLPNGELFEQGYGISSELDRLEAEGVDGEEALEDQSLCWHRLLATSRALFSGASFENLRMPAYGGSLFDPARFPFLTSRTDDGTLAIAVSDRVMLHVLKSLQYAAVQGDARRLSFSSIDVEQIGYVYEGLLGYTCEVVNEPHLGLLGKKGEEPEIPLAALEELAAENPDPGDLAEAIRAWLKEDQPSAKSATKAALAKKLQVESDPVSKSALAQVTAGDPGLRQRIEPWLGIVRSDLRGYPLVVLDDGLLVAETPSRKNAGAHYTPKSLAEEVVLHALEPLSYSPGPHQTNSREEWQLKSSDELLDLKIADIACGSGAFLVAAADYLAKRVVEAWEAEDPTIQYRENLHKRAVRQVVANCLYGADINAMAVEMCKLSLWLVSLDRDLPFSFVDDKIFVGNSLLGITDLDQLRKLHIDPSRVHADRPFDIFDVDIDSIIRRAADLRRRLATEIDERDPARSASAKRRQMKELQDVTATLREIADGIIAAGLELGGKPGKALDEAYSNLRQALHKAYPPDSAGAADAGWLEGIIERGLTPTVDTDYERWKPLHWAIEAPDVIVERGRFDAVVGNPPFLGGHKISPAYGANVESWIKLDLAGLAGSADICAHFIRRAWSLTANGGSMGIIGSERVGQGKTALMSTGKLVSSGFLYRAVARFEWPGEAKTHAAKIWAARVSATETALEPTLNCQVVGGISVSLSDISQADMSRAEKLTLPFKAGRGVLLYGNGGFILEKTDPLIDSLNPIERMSLRPYVNGDSLMSGQPPDKLAIDADAFETEGELFEEMPLLASHLHKHVKPYRDTITSQIHETRYWSFWDKRLALFAQLSQLKRFVVCSLDTRVPVFVFSRSHTSLYMDGVVVIATDQDSVIGVLNSIFHFSWFERARTPRGNASKYVITRCLRQFPFPDLSTNSLASAASEFVRSRDVALAEYVSITDLYNAFDSRTTSDPLIDEMRLRQMDLDRTACAAYGWSDLDLDGVYGFYETCGSERFIANAQVREEIRSRLLEENLQQAAGHGEASKSASPRRTSRQDEALF